MSDGWKMGGQPGQRGLGEGKWVLRGVLLLFVGLLVAGVCIIGMAGCTPSRPVNPCDVNPTRQAADGTWVEHDGGPLDDDPCDSDDLLPKVHAPTVKVPEPAQKSPAKPAVKTQAPIGGVKRKF